MSSYTISPEFAPKEPLALLRAEQAFFIEIGFEAVFYGMTAILFFLTVRSFIIHQGLKKSWKMITFLSVQHIAVFIGVFGNIHFAVLAFVYNRNIQGGPIAFQNEFSNLPVPFAALAGFSIGNWLQDVLLLWRFLIIWERNYKLFVFPFILFLTSIAFSLAFFVSIGRHSGLFSQSNNLTIIIIYFSLSVGLNFVLTFLISARLLYLRNKHLAVLGRSHESNKRVFSVLEIIVESAALYTATGIAQIVAIPISPTVEVAISGVYGVMPAFATVLISYRVSQGRAYSTQTFAERSTLAPRHTFKTHNYNYSESLSRGRSEESTTDLTSNADDIPLQICVGKDSNQRKDFKISYDMADGAKLNVDAMTGSDFGHDN